MIRLLIIFIATLIIFFLTLHIAGQEVPQCKTGLCLDPRFNYLEENGYAKIETYTGRT